MRAVVVASAVATLALTSACTSSAPGSRSSAARSPDPSGHRASTWPASAPASRPARSGTALTLLGSLAVKGRAPKTGYSRAQFGASWTDDNAAPDGHNGCRTRDDILDRDLARARTSNGCTAYSGVLLDPYTGARIEFRYGVGTSEAVQIDHVVALGDAWQTGAQQWSVQKRTEFANDPLNLLAVDGSTNEAKGDSDAASWLPPNKAYRCAYVARQVAVKARYALWVTAAERDAIARVLSRCPDEPAPTEGGAPSSVAPRATPTRTPSPATSSGVVVYRNCAALNLDYPHGVGLPGAREVTCWSLDRRSSTDHADRAPRARRRGQASVGCDERTSKLFGQGNIGRVVSAEIRAKFVGTRHERQHRIPVGRQRTQVIHGRREPSCGHGLGQPTAT